MSNSQIFLPVLAQVFLTLAMYVLLAVRKGRALKEGAVDLRAAALDNKAWPEDVVKVSNNIANQFESPILFYVLCLVFYGIGVDLLVLTLAWVYALSRYVHAYAHVGRNYVPVRLRIFQVGFAILLAMLVLAAWRLILG